MNHFLIVKIVKKKNLFPVKLWIEKSHEGGRKTFLFSNVSAKDGVVKKNDIWV